MRRELSLRCVQPPDDLLGALGQQPASVGQPDAAADSLKQLGTGLGLEPGDVMADRRLGVVQRTSGRCDGAVPGDRDQDP